MSENGGSLKLHGPNGDVFNYQHVPGTTNDLVKVMSDTVEENLPSGGAGSGRTDRSQVSTEAVPTCNLEPTILFISHPQVVEKKIARMANKWNFDHIQRTTSAYVELNYMVTLANLCARSTITINFLFSQDYSVAKTSCRKFSAQISCRDLGDYSCPPLSPPRS